MCLSCNNNGLNYNGIDDLDIEKEYYSNGLVFSEIVKYSEERTDSTFYFYYDDMSIKAKIGIKDGVKYGPCLYYYKGGILKRFIYYSGRFEDDAMFMREYSLDSSISNEYGKPFMVVFEEGLTGQLNSYFDFIIITAVPPNTTSSLNKYSSVDSVDFTLDSSYEITDFKRIPVFRHFLDSTCNNIIRVESILIDTLRDYLRKDTFNFNIIVK